MKIEEFRKECLKKEEEILSAYQYWSALSQEQKKYGNLYKPKKKPKNGGGSDYFCPNCNEKLNEKSIVVAALYCSTLSCPNCEYKYALPQELKVQSVDLTRM